MDLTPDKGKRGRKRFSGKSMLDVPSIWEMHLKFCLIYSSNVTYLSVLISSEMLTVNTI